MRGLAAAFVLLVACAIDAHAQVSVGSTDKPRRGSIEVSLGVSWHGGLAVDALDATLTGNGGNDSPGTTLFEVDGTLRASPGFHNRIGFYLSPAISVEGGVQYVRPVLAYSLSSDFEGAEAVTVEETIQRFVFEGGLLYHMRHLSFAGGRAVPFLLAGAGHIRELHEGRELLETGTSYQGGAGFKMWFGAGDRRLGVRLDGGVAVRDGGYNGGADRRVIPTAGASLMVLF